jgi:hypothetical protein
MEYRVAVVIQPKNSTDLAGTIVFGEHVKDLGTVMCMVTPEHDVIPFADNDQPMIDRKINNILTEGDLTEEGNTYIHNLPDLPKFDISGDASIMIVKKGGESFVHNDIEKYIETLNGIYEETEPYVMHTKYKGVDRIQMPYMTDEVVFWRMKTYANGENKYHSLEEQIRHLLDVVCSEYRNDTERFLNLINKFYACGCDPKIQSWHKSNLDQINRDDKILRLFGELSSRRHNIENIEDILNGLKDDITEGCYIQQLSLDRGADRFVNLKIYSNFKFPRVRGIILGYDGANICAGRFDCTSSNGIPLYVAVDTWVGNETNPPILIAPADSGYTMTVDTRAKLYLITDIPECVYEVLDDRRMSLEEAMRFPLSTQFNGDFIKNTKNHMLYNIGDDTVIAQEISIVGELEEDLLEPYLTAYRVSHRLPQLIDDIDDEMIYIIASVANINGNQLMRIVVKDNYDNKNVILDKTMTYNEYKAMAGGYAFRYPNVYPNGIDYNVEITFVKRDGNIIQNTTLYDLRTAVVRSDKVGLLTEDLEFTRNELHIRKYNDEVFEAGTIVKAIITNGNGVVLYNGSITASASDVANRYMKFELPMDLEGVVNMSFEIKEPNKFQSLKQTLELDMNKVLPNNYYEITNIEVSSGNIYLDRNVLNRLLLQDKTYYNSSWYDSLSKIYSEHPTSIYLKYNCGAPKVEVITRIKSIPNMEDLEWTQTYERSLTDVNNNGIIRNDKILLDVDTNTLPYNIYFDKILREGNFDDASRDEFRAVISDLIATYGGKYEITIKTYDTFDKPRKTVTYLYDSPINKRIENAALDPDDIVNELFITSPTEDNMVSAIKLNPGMTYANMEFMLMINTEDSAPSKDTKLFRFYIDENGLVTKASNINYDSINRDGNQYTLFTNDELEDIASKQNIVLWVKPRNRDNTIFHRWYIGGDVNNTFYKIEREISRAVPKAPGVTRVSARANITDVIDYINDEYIRVNFTHNIARSKRDQYSIKVELFDDTGASIESVEKPANTWDDENRTALFETVRYPKDVNKFKVKVSVTNNNDPGFTSINKEKETEVIVYRTKQPWFSNVALAKLPLNNLDIKLAEGTSYPIDTKFWVKIENDDGEVLFEYNGAVDIVDILNGYHRIYISKKPEGVFTLSVIAKELGKYQSLIYRTSAEFVLDPMKYGSVYYDNDKELSVFRYVPGQALGEEVAKHIKNMIRRTEPGREVTAVKVKTETTSDTYTLDNLKDAIIPDGANIFIELEAIAENEYRYINVFFNGNRAGKIVAKGGVVTQDSWNEWSDDYKWVYDLSILDDGFDVKEINPDDNSVAATKHVTNPAAILGMNFDINKIKSIEIDGVKPREAFKDIKLKINDIRLADFDSQTKRELDYSDGVYSYKRPNTRENTQEDFDNFVNFVKRAVTIKSPTSHVMSSIMADGEVVWSAEDPYDANKWMKGKFDNKELTIVIEPANKIEFKVEYVFPQNTALNYTKSIIVRKQVGEKIDGPEIDSILSDFITEYGNAIRNGNRLIPNIRKAYKVRMYYNNAPIENNYKMDCLFNRLTTKTVAQTYAEAWSTKPAIDGFAIDNMVYTIKVELIFKDPTIANPSLRNHTAVNIRTTNASVSASSGFFKDLSKVYVYRGEDLELISGSTLYNDVFLYIPNGGNLYDLIDISKAVVDAGYNSRVYEITWNGSTKNNGEASWDSEYYSRPIAYTDKNTRVFNISYSNASRAPVVQAIRIKRNYNGDVNKVDYLGAYDTYMIPIQVTDDSSTTRDLVADIILNTPELMKVVTNLPDTSLFGEENVKHITKDNIWQLLEYPMVIPKYINMDIELEFDRDYTDTVGMAYYPGRDMSDTDMLNNAVDVLKRGNNYTAINRGLLPRTYEDNDILYYPDKYYKKHRSINTLDLRNGTRVSENKLKFKIKLFDENVSTDKDITSVNYITLADYVIAYNMMAKTYIGYKADELGADIDDIVLRSYRTKRFNYQTLAHAVIFSGDAHKYTSKSTTRFHNIFLQAIELRRAIRAINPINPFLSTFDDDKESIDSIPPYTFVDNRLNINKGYITIDGHKVALEINDSTLNGDIFDAIDTLKATGFEKKMHKMIKNMHRTRSYKKSELASISMYSVQGSIGDYTSMTIVEPAHFVYQAHGNVPVYIPAAKNNIVPYITEASNFPEHLISTFEHNNLFDLSTYSEFPMFGAFISDPFLAVKNNNMVNYNMVPLFSMTNGIFFPLPSVRTINPFTRENLFDDAAPDLELIVRIEDFYTDKDAFNYRREFGIKFDSRVELPNILYDTSSEKEVISLNLTGDPIDLGGDLDISAHSGLCRITLIPRRISDIDMNHSDITSFTNSGAISNVVSSNLENHTDKDPDYKFEQYVGMFINDEHIESDPTVVWRLSNKKFNGSLKNIGFTYFPVRGMMQSILKSSIPSNYKQNGIMVLEVNLEAITSIGRTNGIIKYYILLNTNNVQSNLNIYSNSQGSWSNDLEFKVVPKKDNPFDREYSIGPVFTTGVANENYLYKTDSNTFTINIKKKELYDENGDTLYCYAPTELVGHPVDRFGNTSPKLTAYGYEDQIWNNYQGAKLEIVNHRVNGIDYNHPDHHANTSWYSDDRTIYGYPVYFPVDDFNKSLWAKHWYRRISYVLKEKNSDNVYFYDSTFASTRLKMYEPMQSGQARFTSFDFDKNNKSDTYFINLSVRDRSFRLPTLSLVELGYYLNNNSADTNDIANNMSNLPFDIYSILFQNMNDQDRRIILWRLLLNQLIYMFTGFYNKRFTLDQTKRILAVLFNRARKYSDIPNLALGASRIRINNPEIVVKGSKFDEFWNKYIHLFDKVYDNDNSPGKAIVTEPMIETEVWRDGNTIPPKNAYFRSRSTSSMRQEEKGIDIINDWMDGLDDAARTIITKNPTKKLVLSADLDSPLNPTSANPNILAKTKVGNTIRLLVESSALNHLYKVVDYVRPSLVTILQPSNGFMSKYITIIDIELQNTNSVVAIGNWLDGFDLGRPTYIRWNDSGYLSEADFNTVANTHTVVNNLVIGWYKPGIDPDFTAYTKNAKKSGLYLKAYTMLTKQNATENINRSEEFYYPLFRTITEHVNRKLDLIYGNETLHVRTSDCAEVVLPNGATFIFNPLLDYLLSIIDNTSESKLHRIY